MPTFSSKHFNLFKGGFTINQTTLKVIDPTSSKSIKMEKRDHVVGVTGQLIEVSEDAKVKRGLLKSCLTVKRGLLKSCLTGVRLETIPSIDQRKKTREGNEYSNRIDRILSPSGRYKKKLL